MKQRLAKFLCSLLAAVLILPLFLLFSFSAKAQTPAWPQIASTAGLCLNLETDTLLFEKNPDSRIHPAAFAKLMTALLAFEYRAEHGNVSVCVTSEMLSSAAGTTMKLKEGEVIAFDDLLAGLLVQNANDAALVLASVAGGNISSFVEAMNEKAASLGMEQTHYANPTGMDSAAMYTTLRDTLILCKALYRINDFMVLSEKPKVTIPATNATPSRVYTNRNALIPYSYITDYYMEGVRGMIAGGTSGAGYCVATLRKTGNCTNLVIISGGVDRSEKQNGTDISSYRDAKGLMEWAENNFSLRQVLMKDAIICEKKVRLASGVDHMILVSGTDFQALLPTEINPAEEITTQIRTPEEVFTAPIIEGNVYGEVDLIYQGKVIGTVPLVAQSNIGLSPWLVIWDAIVRFFDHGPARVVLILVITSGILYVLVLIGSVWLQHVRRNRERNLAIAELNERENRRMRQVRKEERLAARAKLHRAGVFFREGFRVLSGEAEVMDSSRNQKRTQPRKAVAKVPEKYRSKNRSQTPSQNIKTPLPARPVQKGTPPNTGRRLEKNVPPRPGTSANHPPYNSSGTYRISRQNTKPKSADVYRVTRPGAPSRSIAKPAPTQRQDVAKRPQSSEGTKRSGAKQSNRNPSSNIRRWPD